jgi:hypothetical protein
MQIVYRNSRFSAKVDRCLRRRWRMHGDLSIRVREALDGVNLLEVELLDVDSRRVHATQVGVFESAWLAVHEAARARGCSLNTLVNSAVWVAFGAPGAGQRGRPRGRNQRGDQPPKYVLGRSNIFHSFQTREDQLAMN